MTCMMEVCHFWFGWKLLRMHGFVLWWKMMRKCHCWFHGGSNITTIFLPEKKGLKVCEGIRKWYVLLWFGDSRGKVVFLSMKEKWRMWEWSECWLLVLFQERRMCKGFVCAVLCYVSGCLVKSVRSKGDYVASVCSLHVGTIKHDILWRRESKECYRGREWLVAQEVRQSWNIQAKIGRKQGQGK